MLAYGRYCWFDITCKSTLLWKKNLNSEDENWEVLSDTSSVGMPSVQRCPSTSQSMPQTSRYRGVVSLSAKNGNPSLQCNPFVETNISPQLLLSAMVLWVEGLSSVAPSTDSVCELDNVCRHPPWTWCRALSLATTRTPCANCRTSTISIRSVFLSTLHICWSRWLLFCFW